MDETKTVHTFTPLHHDLDPATSSQNGNCWEGSRKIYLQMAKYTLSRQPSGKTFNSLRMCMYTELVCIYVGINIILWMAFVVWLRYNPEKVAKKKRAFNKRTTEYTNTVIEWTGFVCFFNLKGGGYSIFLEKALWKNWIFSLQFKHKKYSVKRWF